MRRARPSRGWEGRRRRAARSGQEEALIQTDLLGHDFYVFMNSATNLVNVIYHRNNGGYGIIKPKDEAKGRA